MGKTFRITVNGRPYTVEVGDLAASPVEVRVDGQVFQVELEKDSPVSAPAAAAVPVFSVPSPAPAAPARPAADQPRGPAPAPAAGSGKNITAPMPGVVLAVRVKDGDRIHRGQEVCLLESMKMELNIMATADGVVKKVCVAVGQSVVHGTVLVEIE
ncbi:MAG: acetyl-CoA carboxylase biotin carboxyl carrier protein subunit [Chloroflexi bacterium]|nr:acetyl-CoA carboxylase biotin carboxyl carrier protein subunit [Chloroflexota bacterium]